MELPFRQKDKAKRLHKPVQEYMQHKFALPVDYLGELRCFEYDSDMNGKPVKYLRIFNSRPARSQNTVVRTNADLDRQPQVLIYQGYRDNQGNIYIEELRTMSYPHQETPRQRP